MQHLIQTFGYPAIFLLMLVESACVPIPSEVIMLFGGALAGGAVASTHLQLGVVIALGALGNLAGSYLAWAVGRTGGRAAVRRWGRLVWLKEEDLARAEHWFARRGQPAVFLGRMMPVVRTFISLPAGVGQMPPLRFGFYTLAGCLPWTAALGATGYALGSRWMSIVHWFSGASYVIGAIAVVAIAAALVTMVRHRRAQPRRPARMEGGPEPEAATPGP